MTSTDWFFGRRNRGRRRHSQPTAPRVRRPRGAERYALCGDDGGGAGVAGSCAVGSAGADAYQGPLPVADAEGGPGRVGPLTRRQTAGPIDARPRGEMQIAPAHPDVQAGARMKAAPGGLDVVDPRRELIVEPVRDEQAAAEVREDATAQALAWSEGASDTGAPL